MPEPELASQTPRPVGDNLVVTHEREHRAELELAPELVHLTSCCFPSVTILHLTVGFRPAGRGGRWHPWDRRGRGHRLSRWHRERRAFLRGRLGRWPRRDRRLRCAGFALSPSGPGKTAGPAPGVTFLTSPDVSLRISFGARWALPNSNMLSTLPESTSSEPAPIVPRLQFSSTNLMIDDCSVSELST